jgi:hypothetical protein
MALQVRRAGKLFAAHVTSVRPLSGVSSIVEFQAASVIKDFCADFTFIGVVVTVDA